MRLFFSYRDKNADDDRVAKALAEILNKKGMKPILEEQKKRFGDDITTALYQQLSAADVVISIISADSWTSDWIRFEARTALAQRKWIPVLIEKDAALQADLKGFGGAWWADLSGWDGRTEEASELRALVAQLQAKKARGLRFRGSSLSERRTGTLLGAAGAIGAALLALVTFVEHVGSAKDVVCSNQHAIPMCTWLGWSERAPRLED